MKLIDCFMYFDEDVVLDIRLNVLNDKVDKFVIVESKMDHSGNEKKLNFDINNFKKFKNKIEYLVVDELQVKKKMLSYSWRNEPSWLRENFQRNFLSHGYKNEDDNDCIMISDIDEIPDPKKINLFDKKKKYACFIQRNFQMKINLFNSTIPNWYGTRICIKKYLKSPQWLRNIKVKKKFWKFYKPKPPQLIPDSGWHFSFLKDPDQISKKIKSYAHQEYNKEMFSNINAIKERIDNNRDLLERDYKYKKIDIDETFPEYIIKNKKNLIRWII